VPFGQFGIEVPTLFRDTVRNLIVKSPGQVIHGIPCDPTLDRILEIRTHEKRMVNRLFEHLFDELSLVHRSVVSVGRAHNHGLTDHLFFGRVSL
jgi:hypothetical protein